MNLLEQTNSTKTKLDLDQFPTFACPVSHTPLELVEKNVLYSPKEGMSFEKKDHIWRFLLPERKRYFEKFINEYEKIREAEGRGSKDKTYYQELPFRDLSGRFVENWQIRAKSYITFVKKVLEPFQKSSGKQLRILDLGAGNGWLSNRLNQKGQQVVAVDLLTNPFDGLRACDHYASQFELVQAEFEMLPFPDSHFDMAIFNASLHYSENYEKTLSEALRVLARKGLLVILDSPVYHDPQSGKQMVAERESFFTRKFGFPSNTLKSEHYLTFKKLQELAENLQINWQIIKPFYGLKWHLKPLLAKLRGSREPARFLILVGCKN